ncbi:hypothetical protein EBZ39_14890 [bacterium]|nr:hypothetical protein [bacterium]
METVLDILSPINQEISKITTLNELDAIVKRLQEVDMLKKPVASNPHDERQLNNVKELRLTIARRIAEKQRELKRERPEEDSDDEN